jgi:hypothetical protein
VSPCTSTAAAVEASMELLTRGVEFGAILKIADAR